MVWYNTALVIRLAAKRAREQLDPDEEDVREVAREELGRDWAALGWLRAFEWLGRTPDGRDRMDRTYHEFRDERPFFDLVADVVWDVCIDLTVEQVRQ